MLRKFVWVGFHSFPVEGAASWEAAMNEEDKYGAG
jgi:hypothetical protein